MSAPLALAAALALSGARAAPPVKRFNTVGEKTFGVLLLGEGGDREWRSTIDEVKKRFEVTAPVAFAPGMADRRAMQKGLDDLQALKCKAIVVVPLFVSSYGEDMDQVRYLLGIRETPAKGLERPGAHVSAPPARLVSKVPLVLTKALDDHPLFVELLAARAQSLSRKASEEALVLVGESPESEDDAKEFANAVSALAEKVRQKAGFAAAKGFAMKPGARQADRESGENALRTLVKDLRHDHKVIVVPLTLTGGRLKLNRALDGLFAKYDGRALLPDARIAQWVEQSAVPAAKLPDMRMYRKPAQTTAPGKITHEKMAAPPSLTHTGDKK